MKRKLLVRIVFTCLLFSFLSACGQSGKLYLPEEPAKSADSSADPAKYRQVADTPFNDDSENE